MGEDTRHDVVRFRDQWRLRESAYARVQLRHRDPDAPPLYEQLREGLRELVLERQLRPGDILIPRRHLCEKLGVNRVIVNQAIRDLIQDGLLSSQHGRGVFVSAIKARSVGLIAALPRAELFRKPLVAYSLIAAAAAHVLKKANLRITFITRERRGPGLLFGPALEEVRAAAVDAYMPLGIQNEEYLQALVRLGKPMVALDASPTLSAFDGVVFDTFRAGYLATRHLLEHGHSRIFFIGLDRGIHSGDPAGLVRIPEPDYERMLAGYSYALKQAGVSKLQERIFEHFPEPGSSEEARLKQKIVGGEGTAAVLTRRAADWLLKLVKVPHELSVVIPMAPRAWTPGPFWSRCVFREKTLGEVAARRLLMRLEEGRKAGCAACEEPSMLTVPPLLVTGKSVRRIGPPPAIFRYLETAWSAAQPQSIR